MSNENRRNALWVTMMQAALLGVVAGLSGYLLLTTILRGARARAGSRAPPGFKVRRRSGRWRLSGLRGTRRSSRSSTRTATAVSTTRSARPRASRSPPSRGPRLRASRRRPRRVRTRRHGPGVPRAQGDARRRQVLSERARSTTSARSGRSSCSSRTPTGSRSSPPSTTPTSRCRRSRRSTARPTRTSASTSAARRRT